MLYGETGKTREENDLILFTAHTRQTPKAYIYSIQFNNQIVQHEPIGIPVDRKNCRDSSELWDVPLLEKSQSKYGYPIYQLMICGYNHGTIE